MKEREGLDLRVFGRRRGGWSCGRLLLQFRRRTRRAIGEVLVRDWGGGKLGNVKAKGRAL